MWFRKLIPSDVISNCALDRCMFFQWYESTYDCGLRKHHSGLQDEIRRTEESRVRGERPSRTARGERSGRPRRLSEKHLRGINAALRRMPRELGLSGNLLDGKTLAAWIEREYEIDLGIRQCQRLFRRLGFRLRKPRPGIAQADPERQNAAVDLWATDEVHVQQHGWRCRMWVPPETKDPVLRHHPTRRSVGYFGAVRLRDGKFQFSRETGKFNAVTFLPC
jgi:transposase